MSRFLHITIYIEGERKIPVLKLDRISGQKFK